MNFLGLGKKKEDSDRDKQIKEFRNAFPNVRRPNHNDSTFEIMFKVNELIMTLRIFLTGDFPIGKPGKLCYCFNGMMHSIATMCIDHWLISWN